MRLVRDAATVLHLGVAQSQSSCIIWWTRIQDSTEIQVSLEKLMSVWHLGVAQSCSAAASAAGSSCVQSGSTTSDGAPSVNRRAASGDMRRCLPTAAASRTCGRSRVLASAR